MRPVVKRPHQLVVRALNRRRRVAGQVKHRSIKIFDVIVFIDGAEVAEGRQISVQQAAAQLRFLVQQRLPFRIAVRRIFE